MINAAEFSSTSMTISGMMKDNEIKGTKTPRKLGWGNPNEIKEHLSISKPLVEDRRASGKYNPIIGRREACGLLSASKHKGLEIQAKF